MELFSMPRYRINIFLLRLLGQWPYQSKIKNTFLTCSWIAIILSLLIPQIHRCIIEPTVEVLTSNLPPLMTVGMSIAKMINSIFKANKFRQLLVLMQDEWARLKPGPDFNIMTKYANNGYKYTILYCILLYNSMIIFLLLPMRPKLMELLGLSKVEADFQLPYPSDYWIDSDKYFILIESHICFGTIFVVTAIVAPDVFFLIFVQHACGIFTVICNRLENIQTNSLEKADLADESFIVIRDCIKQHNRVIEFSELLDNTYSWAFFYVVSINTLLLTFSGIQIVTHMDDTNELFRYCPFAMAQLTHVFVESIISQQMINYSNQVDYAIIMMKWYAMPLKSQKLLNLMTMRSRVTCQITAGSFFVLSVEFFGVVVKTSMSYFTLLQSAREE